MVDCIVYRLTPNISRFVSGPGAGDQGRGFLIKISGLN